MSVFPKRSRLFAACFGTVLATTGWSTDLLAQATKNDVTDYDTAQRLHLVFSDVPNVYCMTPAARAALATTDAEIAQVEAAMAGLRYSVTELKGFDSGHPVTRTYKKISNQGEYDSLDRILRRLELIRARLAALPPCDIDYLPVFSGGFLLGVYVNKSVGDQVVTERFVLTDQTTNQFSDYHDPFGVGINIAYAFAPWRNNVVVAPYVSLEWPNLSVNHTFPGGSFLGSTSNVSGTAGVKIGPTVTPNVWLYGIAGLSVLNETLNINFIPVASSTTATVPGATVGIGGAWQPNFLQGFGRPVSLFLEYQHTWWQSANFNTPAASPLFDYNFARQDDAVKFGFNVSLNPPPAAASGSPMVVKAPPSK